MSQPSISVDSTSAQQNAELDTAVRYLDALDIFSKGDLERVRAIIPSWMSDYDRSASDASSAGQDRVPDPLIASCTPLHLAVQCPRKDVIAAILDFDNPCVPIDAPDQNGMTALHLASKASRKDVVRMLLRHGADDMLLDAQGHDPLAYATEPDVAAMIQDHRSALIHSTTATLFSRVRSEDNTGVAQMLADPALSSRINLAARDGETNGTLLHMAVRHGDLELAKWAVTQGVDVFARDARGHMAEKYAGDDAHMKELLSQAPMGNARSTLTRSAPHLSGELYKWTNYMGGWKSRWFELTNGVLSYYKSKVDIDEACRGAINLRIAKIILGKDKTQFEVHGKGSNKYRLKAADQAMAKQWVHLLNVSKQWATEEHKSKAGSIDQQTDAEAGESTVQLTAGDGQARGRTSGLLKPDAQSVRSASQQPLAQQQQQQHVRGASTSSLGDPALSGGGSSSGRSRALSASPPHDGNQSGSSDVAAASPASSIMSNESDDDDELYMARDKFLAAVSDLRSQLFIQDRLLTGLGKPRGADGNERLDKDELLKYLEIAAQTITQSHALVDLVDRLYRETSTTWQTRLKREQERIDMLADSLRTAVVSSQNLLESVRQQKQPLQASGGEAGTSAAAAAAATAAAASAAAAVAKTVDPVVGLSDAAATPSRSSEQSLSDDEDDEDDFADATDEFFDAAASMVSYNNGGMRLSRASSVKQPRASSSEERETSEEAAAGEASPDEAVVPTGDEAMAEAEAETKAEAEAEETSADGRDLTALSGYSVPVDIRTTLPEITTGGPSLNLWGVIKGAIGKDLSKISVPVFFNEPTSFLQRFTEDMEYCDLLEIAALMPRSEDRTLFVAGFAMSNYASTFGRIAKPFNPLLGETFEYVRRDKKYRALSEQVEHHPPISACWVEGKNYVYHADTNIKSKFNGGSLTVVPTGVCHVELKLPLEFLQREEETGAGAARQQARINEKEGYFVEHYTWNKLTTNVNGIMLANFWIEHVGDLDVRNHRTGDATRITFLQSNWMGKNKFRVTGEARNRRGDAVYEIAGDWTSKLVARPVGGSGDSQQPQPQEAEDIAAPADMDTASTATDAVRYAAHNSLQVPRKPFVLWKANPRQTQGNTYHLTTYAMSLNHRPDGLEPFLCPTDSRFRPDQRAMETGEYGAADAEKSRLENKQRATRRRREQGELPQWKPRWFVKDTDADSGESYWRFTDEYWAERENAARRVRDDGTAPAAAWTSVEDIF
ncbi:hypothetical protein LPJ53_002424 [Coemansia erecta]|uniref:PH domain-containing protein n=1 Tax=Coemansia erecta TaxID=147472 RepID=A0A9W7Y3J1_9FUNG|nr:hypothetical protein LPJ53_002424 [Coemansia erecta]